MSEWFWVVLLWISAASLAFQIMQTRKAVRERDEARDVVISMGVFIDALAKRDVTIPCDDCGNMMTHDMEIDVIEKNDGTVYVGHRSHDRRHDWGKV